MARAQEMKDIYSDREKILCAVSGGPDSMYMFDNIIHFWQQQKRDLKNIIAVYCDHNTRKSSARDTIQSYNNKRCKIIRVWRRSKNKITEAAMRDRRYQQIKKIAQKYDVKTIVFGHNLTDRIESAFLNMLRGCGIQGILGLKMREENHHLLAGYTIYRPLIDMPKEDIVQLCKKKKIPFEIDPTNKDSTYSLRNKLRNDILKKLYKQANSSKKGNAFQQSRRNIFAIDSKITNTAQRTKIQTHPDWKAQRAYKYTEAKENITTDDIYQLCQQQQKKNNITQKIVQEIQQFCLQKHQGYKYRNGIYFFAHRNIVYAIAAPRNFWIRKKNMKTQITTADITLGGQKIHIAQEYRGLSIQYITQEGYKKGSKSRSKRCINNKIPLIRRQHIPVIVKDKQIVKIYMDFIPHGYIGI